MQLELAFMDRERLIEEINVLGLKLSQKEAEYRKLSHVNADLRERLANITAIAEGRV